MTNEEIIREDFKKYEKKWISKEGYICYVILIDGRHRCGYVRVNKKNITNEISDYNDVPVEVHGGLTYGSKGIWGFDCAHYGDTLEEWTLEKVEQETNKLSEQLFKLTWKQIVDAKLEYMPEWFKKALQMQEEEILFYKKGKEEFRELLRKQKSDFAEKVEGDSHGLKIIDVKIVDLCSKCRTEQDKIPKNKFGVPYEDSEICCLNDAFGKCKSVQNQEENLLVCSQCKKKVPYFEGYCYDCNKCETCLNLNPQDCQSKLKSPQKKYTCRCSFATNSMDEFNNHICENPEHYRE